MTVETDRQSASNARKPRRRAEPPAGDRARAGDAFATLLIMAAMAVILAVAGALFMAMVFSLFTMNLEGLARAAGAMLEGVFLDGSVAGLGAGLLGGVITLPIHRSSAPIVATASGLAVFCCYALFSMFDAAMIASSWGAVIGGTIGLPLGVLAGWKMDREPRIPRRRRSARGKPRRPSDPSRDDTDYWLADFDGGDDD